MYLASNFIVVQVHGRSRVLSGFKRVHELLGDGLSETHVITAASPQPSLAT